MQKILLVRLVRDELLAKSDKTLLFLKYHLGAITYIILLPTGKVLASNFKEYDVNINKDTNSINSEDQRMRNY